MKKRSAIASFWKMIGRAFSSVFFLLTLAFSLITIASAYAAHLSPVKFSAFPAYLAFVFPGFLIITLFFLIGWMIRRKWPFFIPFISLIICWPTINAFFPFHFKTEVPASAIKFMTYNVQYFDLYAPHDKENDNPIIQYILDQDADIVCLQEYAHLYIDGKPALHDELKKKYPYYFLHDITNVNNYKYNGLACLSKYPLLSEESRIVPYTTQFNGSVVFKVDVHGKIITIVNNHLETNGVTGKDREEYAHALSDIDEKGIKSKFIQLTNIARKSYGVAVKTRASQAEFVAKEVDNSSGYIIACGDLNDPPNSYARYTIKGDKLRDAFADTGTGMSHTYNENKFYFRIDHIFHSPNLKAYNCSVDKKAKFSDHYPVFCYFTFND